MDLCAPFLRCFHVFPGIMTSPARPSCVDGSGAPAGLALRVYPMDYVLLSERAWMVDLISRAFHNIVARTRVVVFLAHAPPSRFLNGG